MSFSPKRWFADRYIELVCRVTPRCHDMTRLISLEQEQPNSWMLRLRMRLHYGICIWCERYREHLATIRAVSREYPEKAGELPGDPLSAEAKARLKIALQKRE